MQVSYNIIEPMLAVVGISLIDKTKDVTLYCALRVFYRHFTAAGTRVLKKQQYIMYTEGCSGFGAGVLCSKI